MSSRAIGLRGMLSYGRESCYVQRDVTCHSGDIPLLLCDVPKWIEDVNLVLCVTKK